MAALSRRHESPYTGNMQLTTTLLFLGVVFVADFIGTVAGFGTATTLTPAASFFLDVKAAILVVAMLHVIGNCFKIFLFRTIQWEVFVPFGAASVVFSYLGAILWANLDTKALELLLGLFLVGFAGYSLTRRLVTLPPKLRVALAGGMTSGLSAGILGTGGALRSLFLNAFGLPKETYIATAALLAIVTDVTRIPIYLNNGVHLNAHLLQVMALAIPCGFFGTWVGKKLVAIIPVATFRKVVLAALLAVGLKLVFW